MGLINSKLGKRLSSANLDGPSSKKSLLNLITYSDNEDYNISSNNLKQNINKFSIIDSLPFAQRILVQNAHKKRIWMNINLIEGLKNYF